VATVKAGLLSIQMALPEAPAILRKTTPKNYVIYSIRRWNSDVETEMPEAQTESKGALTPRGQFLTTLNQKLSELEPKLALLLPRYLPAKRFFTICYDSVTRTPALQECTIPSILKCVVEAAEIGLEVGGPKKHAYLVPFRNNKTGKREAQLIIGYIGLAHLAYDAGGVGNIQAHVVRARDHFRYEESPLVLEHVPFDEPCPTCGGMGEVKVKAEGNSALKTCDACEGTARQPRGRAIKYYTVATLSDGGQSFEVMDRADVERIRMRSKAKDSGPWVTDFDEMAKKTVFKRHEKWLPKTDGEGAARLARAIELDNQTVGLEEAANAAAVETTARPMPHEILDEDDNRQADVSKGKDVSSPETAQAPADSKANAVGSSPSPASAPPSREPGDEGPEDEFQTAEEKKAMDVNAEVINPQRLGLLTQTAASAGLDDIGISELLKEFGVGDLAHVTNGMFSGVLGKLAKLPPASKRKK